MEGGLAEAASWVHLRQTIYVYVARKVPMEICLENFKRSGVFQRRDDSAWANRAVFLFARIMKMFLGKREWGNVEVEVEKWFEERPVSFKPIFYKEGDVLEDRPFPVICFAASVPGKTLFDVLWVAANVVQWLGCSITLRRRQCSVWIFSRTLRIKMTQLLIT